MHSGRKFAASSDERTSLKLLKVPHNSRIFRLVK